MEENGEINQFEPFEANPADQEQREAKFQEEWGNDLLYKTTGSILMKPRKGVSSTVFYTGILNFSEKFAKNHQKILLQANSRSSNGQKRVVGPVLVHKLLNDYTSRGEF